MTTSVREAVASGPVVDDAVDHALRPPADPAPPAQPRSETSDVEPRRWTRYAPLLLVAFAVAFSAWMLRAELHVPVYPNDNAPHDALVRFAAQRIRAGHNPFDAWYPYLGLGAPQFTQYQTLAHVFTALLSVLMGGWVFHVENYVLVCTLPVSVYIGARLLGLDRLQAASAALFAPMLSNVTGYGIEWTSFIWSGNGLWSMAWGVWLLPVALGLAWRAIAKRERIALATFVVGLTCALHFMTGYLVLFAFVVFVLLRPHDFVMRLGRSAVVGLGGLAIFAFVFVPALQGVPWVNVNAFQVGTHWFDSYGPHKVLSWLVRGEVFDHGRPPVVTVLVLVGAALCIARGRRSEVARIPLGLMGLSLLLYSGRSVVGPVVNYLPGGGALYLHRYVMGVHFAGMLLAGIGTAWLFRTTPVALRRIPRVHFGAAAAIGVTVVLAVVVMFPVLADRAHVASKNSALIARQRRADHTDGRDVAALVDIAKQRGDGRVYAGLSSGWGYYERVASAALYMFPVQQDTDSVGMIARTDSLSADVEPYFDDTNLADYDLFNVKYVLLPDGRTPGVKQVTELARRGRFTLYEVHTSGYLEAVDTTAAVSADRSDIYAIARPYVDSKAVTEYRHPLVSFAGRATSTPSIRESAPYTGPPGTVAASNADFANGRFGGRVQMTRPGWVMLKESYSPHWSATVDGKKVATAMLTPSYVGIPVPAGAHTVAFAYTPHTPYPLLFLFGGLTLLALVAIPVVARRRATSRS